MWYGAVAPWPDFRANDIIPIWRLILLGILILLFRRIPMVLLFRRHLKEIEDWPQAFFVGFFGPIGVSAVFYLYVSIDFLNQIVIDGAVRQDAARLQEMMMIVIWFLAITSIVVHGLCINCVLLVSPPHDSLGLSVPLGKLGYKMPRTISLALSSDNEQSRSQFNFRSNLTSVSNLRRRRNNESRNDQPNPPIFELGKRNTNHPDEPSRPVYLIEDTPTISRSRTPNNEANDTTEPQNRTKTV